MIGQDHIRRITQVLTGGAVVAVNDVDAARAGQVAAGLAGATVHATAADLIADAGVDAVLVASWGPAHEEQVLAAIAAGKPVFCEKPLAPSSDACLRIMDAEMAAGRRLVQVGFMRRYDEGYLAMKAAAGGRQHRGAAADALRAPQSVRAAVRLHHGNDHQRLGRARDQPGPVAVRRGDRGRERLGAPPQRPGPRRDAGSADPALEMAGGVLVDDELFLNARYGYDVRGEVVGEIGTVALADVSEVTVRRPAGTAAAFPSTGATGSSGPTTPNCRTG